MDSVYNNTFVPLNAGQSWEGKSESISKFTVASVSCITDVSGILHLYFSLNNNNFDFIKTYELKPDEPFIINQKVEGKWFKAKVTNNSGINQTYLRLTTTYKEDIRSDLDIRPLHSEKDTISIPALNECIVDGKLVVSVESVTVSGVTVDISGQTVDIDGQMVKSRLYDSNGYAFASQLVSGNRSLATYNMSSLRAKEGTDIKEVNAVTDANHGGTNLCVYDDVLNDKINNINIEGEDLGAIKVFVSNTTDNPVNCNVTGEVTVNTITGFATEETVSDIKTKINNLEFFDNSGNLELSVFDIQTSEAIATLSNTITEFTLDKTTSSIDISGQRVDISGQSVIIPHLNKTTDSVDISGQRIDISGQSVVIPHLNKTTDSVDISGQRIDISGQSVVIPRLNKTTDSVDISGQSIIIPHLNKTTDSIDISGQVVDISGQSIIIPHLNKTTDSIDISGQVVDISGQSIIIPHLNKTTDSIDISGQRIDISGQNVVIPHLNKTTDSIDISGQRIDISGQSVVIPHLNKTTDSIDISGQSVVIPRLNKTTDSVDISGQSVVIPRLNKTTDSVDISGQSVVIPRLNKTTDSVDISGQRVDISGQSVVVTSLPTITVTSDISGQTVKSNMYASDNGTNWHHVKSDANGILNVHSMLQNGAGTDLTSTLVGSKQSLDTYVANSYLTTRITDSTGSNITAQTGGTYPGYLNTYNPHIANAIIDGSITTINKAFVSGSSPNTYLTNRCNSIGDQYVSLTTNGAGNTVQFDATNNKVKIDPSNNLISIASGQNVGITSTSNTVKIGDASNQTMTCAPTQYDTNIIGADTNAHMIGYSRTDTGYNTATLVRPYTSNSSANSVRAVDSYSYNVCLNNSSNLYLPCTSTTTDTTQSQDVYINNGTTIRNNIGTQDISNNPRSGLNMYQVYPKRTTYTIAGLASTGANNSMLANFGTNTTFSAVTWGKNALKTFYAVMSAGSGTKYLFFEYVDSSGDVQTTAMNTISTASGTTAVTPPCIGINRIYFANASQGGANNQTYSTVDGLYVSATSGSQTPSYYGGFYYANWHSTYTCPNNKIAVLKNFSFYASSGIDVYAFICDPNGGRRMVLQVMNASNFVYQNAEFQILPGETLFFGCGSGTTPLSKQVMGQIYQYDV